MQIILKTILVGGILAIGTSAAFAADPAVGMWKLPAVGSTTTYRSTTGNRRRPGSRYCPVLMCVQTRVRSRS
jgi:hypothetical protein